MSTESHDLLLEYALKAHDLIACARHVDAGANVNASFHIGHDVPLVRAIERGFTEGALLLIERGAMVAPVGDVGRAPLEVAVREGNIAVCRALLTKGAPIDACGPDGNTALIVAAFKLNIEICRLLIEHGANVNASNDSPVSPIRIVAVKPYTAAITILDMLLKAGAHADEPALDKNAPVPHKLTAFQYAVANGAQLQVDYFLRVAGEDPEQMTRDGRTMFDLSTRSSIDQLLLSAITANQVVQCMPQVSAPDENESADVNLGSERGYAPKFGAL